jgi:hypothetical protein
MATEVPKLPFTIMITVCTKRGKTVIVIKKFLLYLEVYL